MSGVDIAEVFAAGLAAALATGLGALPLLLVRRRSASLLGGANAPAGVTVFPATQALGAVQPSVDPSTLVGQETASFTLGMSATGHVLAVDASPVKSIAEDRLKTSVAAGDALVAGSISFPVPKRRFCSRRMSTTKRRTPESRRTSRAAASTPSAVGGCA